MAVNLRELTPLLRRLQDKVGKLRFEENFGQSFKWTGTIEANGEVVIPNPLDKVPEKRIIFRSTSPLIADGSVWSKNYVSLSNTDSIDVEVTVMFYKD